MSSQPVVSEPESTSAFLELGVSEPIAAAITARGFTSPTPVQVALLDPALAGRDVLVSSQTGSGKTVAFGLLLAPSLAAAGGEEARVRPARGAPCTPRAIVIAPTRELAAQVREELSWLLAPAHARVIAVTGGTSVVGELRALAQGADVVVATPGRLNDHLTRGAIDPRAVATVVLDEADEMLDMGFRDELEAILQTLPAERRTVMLSATLPGAIVALASRYQRDPVRIAVEPPGAANANIAHVVHVVPPSHRFDALVNVLLAAQGERTLVFVRTRADAATIGTQLAELGFAAAPISGEMAQRERTQTLDAFRSGRVTALIATDVAARGIDVPEVTYVVHADLPGDGSTLTHRAGRTGRAGRKGTSVLLAPPMARGRAAELLRAAGVRATWRPVPGEAEIRAAAEGSLRATLGVTAPAVDASSSSLPIDAAPDASAAATPAVEPRYGALATALLAESSDPVALVARLLARVPFEGPCAPRRVPTPPPPPASGARRDRFADRFDRGGAERFAPGDDGGPRRGPMGGGAPRPREGQVLFRVNFGEKHGATPSRLLAMVCRRGGVRGTDVGGITIGASGSTFGVAASVARSFATAASRTDKREPHVRIEQLGGDDAGSSAPQSAGGMRPFRGRLAPRGPEHGAPPRKPRFAPRGES